MPETAATATVALTDLPAVGQPLDGGTFAGLTTKKDGTHCAVVLLAAVPDKPMKWKPAMAWAAEQGAELPTRAVSALLYHQLKATHFAEGGWYWTSEKHEADGAYAWYQGFFSGHQYNYRTSYEARVRAVRLIPLSA